LGALDIQIQPNHIAFVIGLVVFVLSLVAARTLLGKGTIRRRISTDAGGVELLDQRDRRSLSFESDSKAASFLARVGSLLQPDSASSLSDLRKNLVQAGFFSRSAVLVYQGTRLVSAIGFTLAVLVADRIFRVEVPGQFLPAIAALSGGIGFIAPSVWLDWRKNVMRTRYRNAFPDFMDLVVVCVESGQSLPGAIDRVSHEIVQFSPELGANLHVVSLELRAGRTLVDALAAMNERVDIEEIKSLQILLKQSEELGASISTTLRIFSEEMREKRLVRAEAKALALPVKMTIPLGLFIFPVILMVILVPVIIRMKRAFF
jgi:tight adherence protein C